MIFWVSIFRARALAIYDEPLQAERCRGRRVFKLFIRFYTRVALDGIFIINAIRRVRATCHQHTRARVNFTAKLRGIFRFGPRRTVAIFFFVYKRRFADNDSFIPPFAPGASKIAISSRKSRYTI